MQFGYNNDFTGLVPIGEGRWLMVCNHEYTTEPLMFRGYDPDNPTEAQVRIGLAAHGLSGLAIERDPGGALRLAPDPRFNRRITATSGGVTPWGTVLSGEENFDQYFGNAALVADPVAKQRLARYGVAEMATERKWGALRHKVRRLTGAQRAAPVRLGGGPRPERPHRANDERGVGGNAQPRPSVAVVYRDGGGPIGF